MDRKKELKLVPHLTLLGNKGRILDDTDALLLRRIAENNSLTEAARLLGISYRNAWGRVKKIESTFGKRILETTSGGVSGGSSALTPDGALLLKDFRKTRKYLFNVLEDMESAENIGYRLSARNRFEARVVGIERGDVVSLIKMTTKAPVSLTSIITEEALSDLGLEPGDQVVAVVKSSEVMVAKQDRPSVGMTQRRKPK
ncbi:MAG TPA: TOBE domain-containing protein [Nitrososphaerales archaeon]|nr:TOBE domain-containing protein [Nitrososphaerales archaeon]